MIKYEQISDERELLDLIEKFKLYEHQFSGNGSLIFRPMLSQLRMEYKAWIAFLDNRVIGLCCIINYSNTKYISTFVNPMQRGKGIGTNLVNRLCEHNSFREISSSDDYFYKQTNFLRRQEA